MIDAKKALRPLILGLPLPVRRILHPQIHLSYPLDGFAGYFPKPLSKKPLEVHLVNQVVEHIRPNHVCLDVGANIGYYTLLFAKYGRTVFAFEPVPDNFSILQQNVALNGLGNVKAYAKAVGAVDHESIRIYTQQPGVDTQASALVPTDTYSDVEQVTLDTFCEENGIRPDLVKIDVEGFETEVLKGMKKVLGEVKPVLFLEIHTGYLSEADSEGVVQTVLQNGYKLYSWAEDASPGGYGFWRHLMEITSARELKTGATLALPQDKYSGLLAKL